MTGNKSITITKSEKYYYDGARKEAWIQVKVLNKCVKSVK